MKYDMSQAELIEAVEFYLNERVLKRPVKVSQVKPSDERKTAGINYVLHVTVTDTQEHIAPEHRDAADKVA